MLNLFILIVLQDFEEYNLKKDNPLEEYKDQLENFKAVWNEFSQEHHGVRTHFKHFKKLLVRLQPPLGVGVDDASLIARKMVKLDLR